VNNPVDSITISTPEMPQGIFLGSLSANILISFPLTIIEFSVASTVPLNFP